MKTLLNRVLRRFGHEIRPVVAGRTEEGTEDLDPADQEILRRVRPYTMTSTERIVASMLAARHVVENRIPGDLVECGVWRGGNMLAMALVLARLGDTGRGLHLYDTFEGMSEPTDSDVALDGQSASRVYEGLRKTGKGWCEASLEDVRETMALSGYPAERVHFIRGKVEETIPASVPPSIAVLRLDTDWYESTRHELVHLYPRLVRGGILMVDDYGHWQGARRATDEYLREAAPSAFLHRIDYTGRELVKP